MVFALSNSLVLSMLALAVLGIVRHGQRGDPA